MERSWLKQSRGQEKPYICQVFLSMLKLNIFQVFFIYVKTVYLSGIFIYFGAFNIAYDEVTHHLRRGMPDSQWQDKGLKP